MTVEQLTEVWNFASILFAIISGLALGAFALGHFASDPAYASGEASEIEYGVLTGILTAAVGLVFFGFQIIATYWDGDPSWTRVVSRFGVWLVYSVAIATGLTIRLVIDNRQKHALAHTNALAQIQKDLDES